MEFAPVSREALAEVLLAAGPMAPTLCQGWQARHLAAHLVLREHSPWAAGILGGPLEAGMERRLQKSAERAADPAAFAKLIQVFRRGPGRLSPLAIPRVDDAANVLEYFVHTEDVRRARPRWWPRSLDAEYEQSLWEHLLGRASALYRGAPVGVILIRPDGQRKRVKRGDEAVAISGAVGELVMHAHGRTEEALVMFEGGEDAVEAMRGFRASL